MDIYSLILEELREGKLCHVDRFPPYYIISTGAHLFNLHNKRNEVINKNGKSKKKSKLKAIYFRGRKIPDTRLHILFSAPPGGEKTFWLEQFLRGEQALLLKSGIGIAMKAGMTEAGFVGTIRFIGGEKVTVPGICYRHMNDIIGVEEFSAITNSLQSEHSKALDPAMLSALDSGWVYKDLAAGFIDYPTHLTLWAATQPARFDLRGGMARRFLFIDYHPTAKDLYDLKWAQRRSMGVSYNPVRTDRIREGILNLKAMVGGIETLEWDEDEIYKFFDEMKLVHWEEHIYCNMLLGYTIMRGRFDNVMHVSLDDTIKQYILQEARYRDSTRMGPEYSEVVHIMREAGGAMPESELRVELMRYGKDYKQAHLAINECIRMRIIKHKDDIVILSKSLRGEKHGPL